MPRNLSSQSGIKTIELESAVRNILANVSLTSLATTCSNDKPHVNVCFIASDKDWRLYFLSDPQTMHAVNIAQRPDCALTLFESSQPFASDLIGVQLFGTAKQLSLPESFHAFTTYAKRFPGLLKWAANIQAVFAHLDSRFFEITLHKGKLLHEPLFGKEVYIDFEVT